MDTIKIEHWNIQGHIVKVAIVGVERPPIAEILTEKVSAIVCPCTNTDHIPKDCGVPVFDLSELDLSLVIATAELTILHMLVACRLGAIDRSGPPGADLHSLKIFQSNRDGRIASIVRRLIPSARWTEDLYSADILCIHDRYQGRCEWDKSSFSLMRGIRIVNTARGGLVDEADLLEAVQKEHVLFYSSDFPASITIPRSFFTNHIGGYSEPSASIALELCRRKAVEFFLQAAEQA